MFFAIGSTFSTSVFCKHLWNKPICGKAADFAMTRLRTKAKATIYRSILKCTNTLNMRSFLSLFILLTSQSKIVIRFLHETGAHSKGWQDLWKGVEEGHVIQLMREKTTFFWDQSKVLAHRSTNPNLGPLKEIISIPSRISWVPNLCLGANSLYIRSQHLPW